MGDNTAIEWTDATWNPVRGCSRVSEGCRHCYAERVAARFSGPGMPYEGLAELRVLGAGTTRERTEAHWTGVVRLIAERLCDPLRWRRPRRVFVNSMSDLFHEALSAWTIDRVLAVMLLAPRHSFQVLTKRPGRMLEYFSHPDLYPRVLAAADRIRAERPRDRLGEIGISNPARFPRPWIWLGVSVEDQATAAERIPLLLETPAAVRFVSYEPALGPIDWRPQLLFGPRPRWHETPEQIDWIICGGESGPGARPMHPHWPQHTRNNCQEYGIPFFFKQWGEYAENGARIGKHAAGRLIDGRTWDEFPTPTATAGETEP